MPVHTTCQTVNANGERIDNDGSHCVRCTCSQCFEQPVIWDTVPGSECDQQGLNCCYLRSDPGHCTTCGVTLTPVTATGDAHDTPRYQSRGNDL